MSSRRFSVLPPAAATAAGAVLLWWAWVGTAPGQGVPSGVAALSAQQRSQLMDLQFPRTQPGLPLYAPPSAGDEDIGVQLLVLPEDRYKPFDLWFYPAVFWTNNAALVDIDESDDTYFVGFLGATYSPRLAETFYGNIIVYQSFYRYDQNSLLDFNSTEAGAGFTKVLPNLGNASFFARYDYERLVEPGNGTELYTEHSVILGFYKVFPVNPKNFFFARTRVQLALKAEPNPLRRHEYSATLGYRHSFSDRLQFNLYYRARWQDYLKLLGNDWNHQVGAAVAYDFNQYISVIASGSIAVNDSSRTFGDYTAGEAGGQVSVSFNF